MLQIDHTNSNCEIGSQEFQTLQFAFAQLEIAFVHILGLKITTQCIYPIEPQLTVGTKSCYENAL